MLRLEAVKCVKYEDGTTPNLGMGNEDGCTAGWTPDDRHNARSMQVQHPTECDSPDTRRWEVHDSHGSGRDMGNLNNFFLLILVFPFPWSSVCTI